VTIGHLAIAAAIVLLAYAALLGTLLALGRRSDATVVARFVPDCVVLFRRLLADPRVPRRRKLVLAASVGYLVVPFDLVPDFIPVAGQLDDAVVVVLALRFVLAGAGPELLAEHWPGPASSRELVGRLVFGSRRPISRP
jgi:uncharacterized membrane protein YkvA (DUF1232 family)